jgi:hypothetical protein
MDASGVNKARAASHAGTGAAGFPPRQPDPPLAGVVDRLPSDVHLARTIGQRASICQSTHHVGEQFRWAHAGFSHRERRPWQPGRAKSAMQNRPLHECPTRTRVVQARRKPPRWRGLRDGHYAPVGSRRRIAWESPRKRRPQPLAIHRACPTRPCRHSALRQPHPRLASSIPRHRGRRPSQRGLYTRSSYVKHAPCVGAPAAHQDALMVRRVAREIVRGRIT